MGPFHASDKDADIYEYYDVNKDACEIYKDVPYQFGLSLYISFRFSFDDA